MDCLFCKIINGEIPSYTIYENDFVKVFLDVTPKNNGHMLIVPKKHFLDITDIDSATLLEVFEAAKKMHQLLIEKLHISGLTLLQNNGDAEQVKHFHLHLLPHYDEPNELKDVKDIYDILKNSTN